MARKIAPLNLDPAWRVTDMPAGPVDLYMAVFADDGQVMGVAPVPARPRYIWQQGKFGIDYGDVRVPVFAPGRYAFAYLVAVAGQRWRPVFRIDLPNPRKHEMRPLDDITVRDAYLLLDFTGGPNDPMRQPAEGRRSPQREHGSDAEAGIEPA